MDTGFCDISKQVHTVVGRIELLLCVKEATVAHEVDKLSSGEGVGNNNVARASDTLKGKGVTTNIGIECYCKTIGNIASGTTGE